MESNTKNTIKDKEELSLYNSTYASEIKVKRRIGRNPYKKRLDILTAALKDNYKQR